MDSTLESVKSIIETLTPELEISTVCPFNLYLSRGESDFVTSTFPLFVRGESGKQIEKI